MYVVDSHWKSKEKDLLSKLNPGVAQGVVCNWDVITCEWQPYLCTGVGEDPVADGSN